MRRGETAGQQQESQFVTWIREETDLPQETWRQLFIVAVKRLEMRAAYLAKELRRETAVLQIHWGLLTQVHGRGREPRAGLDPLLRKMEARAFPRGGPRPTRSVPYLDQYVYFKYVHAEIAKKLRADRGQPEFVRGLVMDVREKLGEARRAQRIPVDLINIVSRESAEEGALSIVAHVCGSKASYLKRKFVDVRKSLDSTPVGS